MESVSRFIKNLLDPALYFSLLGLEKKQECGTAGEDFAIWLLSEDLIWLGWEIHMVS